MIPWWILLIVFFVGQSIGILIMGLQLLPKIKELQILLKREHDIHHTPNIETEAALNEAMEFSPEQQEHIKRGASQRATINRGSFEQCREEYEEEKILVCASCLRASCFKDIFPCEKAKTADVIAKTPKELKELNREHPDYWDGTYERNMKRSQENEV